MAKFTVGDKFVLKPDSFLAENPGECSSFMDGKKPEYLQIVEITAEGNISWTAHHSDGTRYDSCHGHKVTIHTILPYKSNSSENMSIKESFKQLFLKEPQKTFRKLGITDGDNELTAEGSQIFLQYLLGKYEDDFKITVCDPLVAEQKEDEK